MIGVYNNLGFCVSGNTVPQFASVGTRKDPLAELVRLRVIALMAEHDEMEQIELARRSKNAQQRVHRFLVGQMPYPPMSFMDSLLQVFGLGLADVLADPKATAKPPVISDAESDFLTRWRRTTEARRRILGDLLADLVPDVAGRTRRRAR
jgi:hypothetical protein